MIYYHDTTGRITRRVNAPAAEADLNQTERDAGYVISDILTDDARSYVLDGALVEFPPRPAPESIFDFSAGQWTTPLDAIRARIAGAISAEAARRDHAPIRHDGALFDADGTARERINGLYARIARGDGLTDPWHGWRDFDNAMHWADLTAAQVSEELKGITRAIEARTQALLAYSWALKAALAALDLEALDALDVTEGWPA